MKPDDWTKAMQSEAEHASDVDWILETRRALRRERFKRVGLTALATLLIFQVMSLVSAGFSLAGIRSNIVYGVVVNTQEFVLIGGLAVWLGRRHLPLWPLPVVGLLAANFITSWPAVLLGWTTWTEQLASFSQVPFWWNILLKLPLPLLYLVAAYLTGQRWPLHKSPLL